MGQKYLRYSVSIFSIRNLLAEGLYHLTTAEIRIHAGTMQQRLVRAPGTGKA
jgi:hypothetical protein